MKDVTKVILRTQTGSAFIEFALLSPLLLLLTAMTVDFGMLFQEVQFTSAASKHGARFAATYVNDQVVVDSDGAVILPFCFPSSMSWDCSNDASLELGDPVNIVAAKSACAYLNQVFGEADEFQASAQIRLTSDIQGFQIPVVDLSIGVDPNAADDLSALPGISSMRSMYRQAFFARSASSFALEGGCCSAPGVCVS